jgi:peptidoglycan hydrolase FlgJ
MNGIGGVRPLTDPAPRNDREQLRRMSHELEGVFLSQLFSAMRASVPEGGLLEESSGQDLYTSLFQERLASEAASRMNRGLGEAIYKQLSRRLPPEGVAPQD